MIDILIIIIFIITLLLFQIIKLHEEVKIIITLLIASSLFFYIGLNINNEIVSKVFMILTFISILYVPISIIVKYIEKL